MVAIEVPAPLYISSRLMAALDVGDGTLHVSVSHRDDEGRIVYGFALDADGVELESGDDGIHSGVGDAPDYLKAMEAFTAFLSAAAERYRRNMAPVEGDEALFDPAVQEWAYMNSDELDMAHLELSGE